MVSEWQKDLYGLCKLKAVDTSGIMVLTYPNLTASCVAAKDPSNPSFILIQGYMGAERLQAYGGMARHFTCSNGNT